jgi:AmmeMemoRadiSam system protein B
MVHARSPGAAGVFYPAERGELARTVRGLLAAARSASSSGPSDGEAVRAIVAPHSPYASSGAVAASAWNHVAPFAAQIRRVVLLGPAHHLPLVGVAAPFADAFETPIGTVTVDRLAIETARRFPRLVVSDVPHDQEHSIEAQLPFVQIALEAPAIVPLVVGDGSDVDAAEILEALWDDSTLAVVSTNLSHYFDQPTAWRLDEATARAIELLRSEVIGEQQACGHAALRALLCVARGRGMRAARLDLRHSGDEDEVIGFGAFTFS